MLKEHIADKAGDMVFKSCSTCGTPLEMKEFNWDLESGIIKDSRSGRRLAFFGTSGMLAVFDELAHELGERVSDAIIEVERENGLAALSVEEARSGYEGLRFLAAIRGLGLITSLEVGEDRLLLRMSNPSIPEYIVGLALAVFELVTGKRGRHTWSIEPDGDLTVDITL